MKPVMGAILLCLLSLGVGLPQAAFARQDLPQNCSKAKLFLDGKRFDLADLQAEACYEEAGATREVVIIGHYVRAQALVAQNKPKEALAELEFLMNPDYAESPIYDRRSNSLKQLGGTQASIHVEAARLALVLGEVDKGLTYAQKALKLAAMDPATHIDVAGNAYMLRSRIRASRQENQAAAVDLARAFIRGSQDTFVLENIKSFPAADQERINGLKTRMLDAYSKYLKIYMFTGGVVSSTKFVNELKAAGDPLYQSVLADETSYLGPDTPIS